MERYILILMSPVYILPKAGEGQETVLEKPRHLYISNFGAQNNLMQKELLIRAPYTHLIEEGGEELGNET